MGVIADRIQSLGTENAFKIGVDIRNCEAMGMKVIKLNLGEPDFDSAPHINEVAVEEIRKGNSHYTDPAGIAPLREIIAKQIKETRGLDVSIDQIVVTPGAKPPISYTMLTYVNPGDEVIYPSPGFPIYESWVNFLGAKPVPLHLKEEKGFRFSAEELESLITPKTKLIIINSPSNPTGGVLTQKDLYEIAEVIKSKGREDIRIYSDEVYEYIIFEGMKHYSIASVPGMKEKTVIVSGHSKTFAMTGWRLGYAILPTKEEAEIFKHLNINIISCVPPFIQMAGLEAYKNWEKSKPVIDMMVRAFQERRDWVVKALNEIEGVSCAKPMGAFYVFPNIGGVCEKLGIIDKYEELPPEIKKKTSPSTMFQMFLLYNYGVATMDRRSFGVIGSEGQHFLRLSTAASLDNLKEGVKRLLEASKDKEGAKRFLEERTELFIKE